MKKFLISTLAGLIILVFLCGCESGGPNFRRKIYYLVMNTDAELVAYENNTGTDFDERFNAISDEVGNLIRNLDKKLSVTEKSSDISRFNEAQAGERVEICAETYNVLKIAEKVYKITEGFYNPAVYYSVCAYGFNGSSERFPQSPEELPSKSEIEAYVELSSHFSELSLEELDGKFYAVKPEFTIDCGESTLSLKIDLGGVAKGYAADTVNELMDIRGFEYGYFNFGSSSIAVKKFISNDSNMTMKLANPRRRLKDDKFIDPQEFISFPIKDESISSSADNINYFMLDVDGDGEEERFSHIFNPFTGSPVQSGIASAAVCGGSAAENDALTTAIMAMGPKKAAIFVRKKLPERQVVFTCEENGNLCLYTNMPQDTFTVVDSRYKVYEI